MDETGAQGADQGKGEQPAQEQGSRGGIQADRIEANNVVQGMQQLGGDPRAAAEAVALAEALNSGTIRADSIQARNVVAGFQYITDPTHATPEELRQEIARLQQQLAEALAAGELADNADMADAQEALEKAEDELAQEQPQGNRVVRKLKEASDILTTGAGAATAAGKMGDVVIKLAPVAAALYQIAAAHFAG